MLYMRASMKFLPLLWNQEKLHLKVFKKANNAMCD